MAVISAAGSLALHPLAFRATGVASGYAAALVNPPDGGRVPATAVALELVISSTSTLNTDVQVQVATVADFSTTVYNNTLTNREDGAASVTAAGLVNNTKYYWRARAAETGTTGWSAYTPAWTFTVDTNSGKAFLYSDLNIGPIPDPATARSGEQYVDENVGIELTNYAGAIQYADANVGFPLSFVSIGFGYAHYGDVNQDAPGPHVWFIRPSAGRSGDGISIYCFGVGDLVGTYSGSVELYYGGGLGWITVPVVSWQTFPPTVDAYTAARKLDEETAYIDMQHTVVQITIPDGAVPPGYPLRIRTVTP